jgi:sodium transport system permease protein
MLRDKRVRFGAFFGPIILIFGMMSLFGMVFSQIDKKENQKVDIVATSNPIAAAIRKSGVQVYEDASLDAGRQRILKGQAGLVLDFPSEVAPNQQQTVDAYYDPKQETSGITLAVIQGIFGEVNKRLVTLTFDSAGIPTWKMEPLHLEKHEVQVGRKGGANEMLVSFLPYLIVMWAFYGGMGVATDLVAGEKEKSTLETLLISPVKRTQIVLGKFFAIGAICLTTSLSSLVGIGLLALIRPPGTQEMFKQGMGINPESGFLVLALMLPMAALFASILIGISSYAKNAREAQTYLAQVSFVVVLPAVFSQVIGFTGFASSVWVNFIPILNTANNVRNVLLGKIDYGAIGITIGISLVLALIALRTTVYLFNREQVIARI